MAHLLSHVLVALAVAACGAGTDEPSRRPRAPSAAPAPEPAARSGPRIAETASEPAANPIQSEPAKPKKTKRAPPPRPAGSTARVESEPEPEPEPEPDSIVDRVCFAKNDASLGESVQSLDAFANLAMGDDDVTLVLIARAGASERQPESLSSRRALAVRSYLVRSGVPEDRIRTHALGVQQARDPGDGAGRCVELATD